MTIQVQRVCYKEGGVVLTRGQLIGINYVRCKISLFTIQVVSVNLLAAGLVLFRRDGIEFWYLCVSATRHWQVDAYTCERRKLEEG